MYNPRWLTMAKVTAKEGNRSVQCPYAKNGTIGHQKTAKKIWKNFNFFCHVSRNTWIQAFSRYFGPEVEKILAKDFGRMMKSSCKKKDKVLPLSEKDADVIWTGHPDRRLFDLINLIFVPFLSLHTEDKTEQSAVRNWSTSYSLPSRFFSGRNRKDTKKDSLSSARWPC